MSRGKLGLLCLGVLLGLSACNDSPKQYDNQPVPTIDWSAHKPPTSSPLSAPDSAGPGVRDEKAITTKMLLEPIVVGKGAAGITFATSMSSAKPVLSRAAVVETEGGVVTSHHGSVTVKWLGNVPLVITLGEDYKGVLDAGAKLGKIGVGKDLTKLFKEKKIVEFISDLYNTVEGAPESTNCIVQRICTMSEVGPDELMLGWPKFAMIIEVQPNEKKDDIGSAKVIAIQVKQQQSLGRLNNQYDVVFGQVVEAPREAGGKATPIALLGSEWSKIKAQLGTVMNRTVPGPNFYVQQSLDSRLFFGDSTKASTVADVPADDLLVRIDIGSVGFTNVVGIGGEMVVGTPKDGKLELAFAKSFTKEDREAGKVVISTGRKIEAKYHEALNEKFSEMIADRLKTHVGKDSTQLKLSLSSEGSILTTLVAYDVKKAADAKERMKNRMVQYNLSGPQNTLSRMSSALLIHPGDPIVVPGLAQELDLRSQDGIAKATIYRTQKLPEIEAENKDPKADGALGGGGAMIAKSPKSLGGFVIGQPFFIDHKAKTFSYSPYNKDIRFYIPISKGEQLAAEPRPAAQKQLALKAPLIAMAGDDEEDDESGEFIELMLPGKGNVSTKATFATLGTLPVKLSLVESTIPEVKTPTPALKMKKLGKILRIASISTEYNVAGVQGLCGVEWKSVPKPGMTDTEFMQGLKLAMEEESAKKCDFKVVTTGTGTNQPQSVTFPKDGVKFEFESRKLKTTTIYADPEAIAKAIEVKQ